MRVLVLSNESTAGKAPGQRDAVELLVHKGWIDSVSFVLYRSQDSYEANFARVLSALSSGSYDVLFVWSPTNFPRDREDFDRLVRGVRNRKVLYWEGDPWTKRGIKQYFDQMFWWASISTALFSVAGSPQKEVFEQHAKNVFLIPHTYCHIQFAEEEKNPPKKMESPPSFVMIGNQVATIPFLYGVPGSGRRFALANALKFEYREDFKVFGTGWPRWTRAVELPYEKQAAEIRKHYFSVNWDNFPSHANYASDRLPIALLAGRIHVTNLHPGIGLYGDPENGLFEFSSLHRIVAACRDLMNEDPMVIYKTGVQSHFWAKDRFSHRQAAQFMLSKIIDSVPKVSMAPWTSL